MLTVLVIVCAALVAYFYGVWVGLRAGRQDPTSWQDGYNRGRDDAIRALTI